MRRRYRRLFGRIENRWEACERLLRSIGGYFWCEGWDRCEGCDGCERRDRTKPSQEAECRKSILVSLRGRRRRVDRPTPQQAVERRIQTIEPGPIGIRSVRNQALPLVTLAPPHSLPAPRPSKQRT